MLYATKSIYMNKKLLFIISGFLIGFAIKAQTCEELIESVKTNYSGTTFTSYTSDAISKVTFYDAIIDNQTFYFAIVCFKNENLYGCSEYFYQVASSTKLNYSTSYLTSAGKAFWKYIQPYNENLDCAPSFE